LAMQKASAAATEAGLSFEWLGAYIATVSEKTRQAPEVIGTAYNSIIARLHNIKAKGFNEEDETRINDIAKALATLPEPLKLIDSMTGEWQSMSDVFSGIASQWSTLNDKQRAYIATTMAGTRQQNMFITLMNDMSKGADGGSRAYELYAGAIEAAGNATEKYGVYQESLAATQDEANAKWEEFYNIALDSDVFKVFYGVLGDLGKGLATATEQTGGFNLVLIAIVPVILTVVAAIHKVKDALATFEMFSKGTKIGLIVTVITGLIAVITNLVGSLSGANKEIKKAVDYSDDIQRLSGNIQSAAPLIAEYEKLAKKSSLTAEEQKKMHDLFIQIQGSSAGFSSALSLTNNTVENAAANLKIMNDELARQQGLLDGVSQAQARANLSDTDNHSRWATANSDYVSSENEAKYYQTLKKYGAGIDRFGTNEEWVNHMKELQYRIAVADAYFNSENMSVISAKDREKLRSGSFDTGTEFSSKDIVDLYEAFSSFGFYDKIIDTDSFNKVRDVATSTNGAVAGMEESRKEIVDNVLAAYATMFEGLTDAQTSYIEAELLKMADPSKMLTADGVETMISSMKDRLFELVGNVSSDPTVERDALATTLTGIFGKPETWSESVRSFGDQMLDAISDGFITSDTLNKAKENIDRFFNGDKESISEYWGKVVGFSPEARRKIIEEWQDEFSGVTSMLDALASSNGKTANFGHFAGVLGDDFGYSQDEILTYYKQLYGVLSEYPNLFDDISAIYADGVFDQEELDALFQKTTKMSSGEWLAEQKANTEGSLENWQKYFEDLGELSADDEDGISDFLTKLSGADDESLSNMSEAFNALGNDAKKAFKESAGLSDEFWADIADGGKLASKSVKELDRAMSHLNIKKESRHFEGTADAIIDLAQGTIKAHNAFDTFNDDTEKLNEALTEYEKVNEKMSKGLKATEEDVQTVAEYLSTTPDNVLKQWDVAGAALTSAIQEGTNALSALRDQAFINIVGTSSVDFSAVYSGLLDVQSVGEETANVLAALGMFKIETLTMPYDFHTVTKEGKKINYKGNSKASILVPTSGSPFKSTVPKKSGGGGGGGGSEKTEAIKDEQNLVSNMEFEIDTISNKLKQLDLIMSRYDTQGYLTGLINALKMENDLLTQQSAIYQKNIDTLKPKLDALKAQLATQTSGTEAYNETLKQIEVLQDAYVEYSLALEENTNSILENNEAIKDHQDAIRDMEIELRNTILEAIEDRVDREEAALDARIEMEEEVLDAIISRHERERDEILETTEAQIQALEDEKDMLDEMLDARRQAAEEEDKLAELTNLEAKYNRIIADPTRMKEARDILTEIEDLRDEIAWDTTEKEVEAQKDSLDQQITSLEDYMSYIEEYYEDLLSNPRNFIEEVNGILSQSSESILEWLKANNEEFANSTDTTREQMIAGWTDTLNTMRGVIVTYWEEVESIIAGGDDAIIEFLKQNSQEYLEAGRLQAEAYVDGWREQLGDLNAAYKNVTPEIKDLDEINVTETIVSSGTKKSGGGSGGGGGGNNNSENSNTESSGGTGFFDNILAAAGQMWNTAVDAVKKSKTTKAKSILDRDILKYATGGVADYTGLAWIDGSRSRPERILSAEQTQLFETLVASLQSIKMRGVSIPSMSLEESSHGTSMTFGDIVVQVEQLNEETDYEELGERIMTAIMDKANRGSSVGGIRITR